ncbi:helix-turn-helix transcriptional regulator [Nitratireductor sp. GISD-1A_MAKvit]|uniref:helix-turn-helix domain-containing protein n=1 Tax=Nitratireductor sp. GISD-1A_MAKvit TaxID=3234198 RepID=UPI0034665D31
MAPTDVSEQNVRMQQFGNNLRRRAKELGLTDAEVARRVGSSERRYGFYVTGDRESDLATLLRIANVLQVDADRLLRPWDEAEPSKADRLIAQIQSSAAALPGDRFQLLADVAATFAAHDAKSGAMAAGSKREKKVYENSWLAVLMVARRMKF